MIRAILAIASVCVFAACSSTSSSSGAQHSSTTTGIPSIVTTKPGPTVPTTLPPPPSAAMIPAVKAYLAGNGAPLLRFEAASKGLVTTTVPSRQTCNDYLHTKLPRVITGPNQLIALEQAVPDPALRQYFHDDITAKDIVLQACSGLKTPLPKKTMLVIIRDNKALARRLTAYGITI